MNPLCCIVYSRVDVLNHWIQKTAISVYDSTSAMLFENRAVMGLKFISVFWTKTHFLLIHWGRVTHICISTVTIIGLDNCLSLGRRQAIIWSSAGAGGGGWGRGLCGGWGAGGGGCRVGGGGGGGLGEGAAGWGWGPGKGRIGDGGGRLLLYFKFWLS